MRSAACKSFPASTPWSDAAGGGGLRRHLRKLLYKVFGGHALTKNFLILQRLNV